MPTPLIGHNVVNMLFAATASGDTALVTPTAKQQVLVYGIDMSGSTAASVAIKDGSSNVILGAGASSNSFTRDMLPTGMPRFVCTKGNNFVVNLSGAANFNGVLYYAIAQNIDGT